MLKNIETLVERAQRLGEAKSYHYVDWLVDLMYDYEIEQFGDHLKANHDKDFDELREEFGI